MTSRDLQLIHLIELVPVSEHRRPEGLPFWELGCLHTKNSGSSLFKGNQCSLRPAVSSLLIPASSASRQYTQQSLQISASLEDISRRYARWHPQAPPRPLPAKPSGTSSLLIVYCPISSEYVCTRSFHVDVILTSCNLQVKANPIRCHSTREK